MAIVYCIALCACGEKATTSQRNGRLEATVTAESCCSGTVTTRAPTTQEQATIDRSADSLDQIEKVYPRSKAPFGETGFRVVSISESGIFELANGDRVYMDGVLCSAAGLGYIRKLVEGEGTVVIASRRSAGVPTPSELWSAETVKGLESPMYSALAETGLTSGWCVPASSSTNPQTKRYQALSKLPRPQ
jgi:hypothetical protein